MMMFPPPPLILLHILVYLRGSPVSLIATMEDVTGVETGVAAVTEVKVVYMAVVLITHLTCFHGDQPLQKNLWVQSIHPHKNAHLSGSPRY